MPKLENVVVKQSLFGFTADETYEAKKTKSGWSAKNDDGNWIALPNNMVTPVPKSAAQQLAEEQAPPKRKKVGKNVSDDEQSALDAALKGEEDFRPENETSSTGVLAAILEADEQPTAPKPPKSAKAKTPAEAAAAEIERKRQRLVPPAQPLLREGQCWLSDLTGGMLPDSGVDHIITTYPDSAWPDELKKDIPEFDITHEWDANVLESLFLAHAEGEKGLFVGYPGTGKTSSNKNFAALIRQPFMRLNGKDGIDASSFIGFLWAGANGTEFAEGLLPVAMRHGYYMVIDEIFKIPPEIQMNFQTVYEEEGFLLLDEKPGTLSDKLVIPHPEFRLMGTDNAKGTGDDFEKFGATQNQDTSTLDRFGVTTNVPYMKQETEVATLARLYPAVEQESIERLVRIANLVREGYSQNVMSLTLSMRGLKVMCRFILRGLSEVSAYRKVYHAKLSNEDEVETSNQHIRAVGLSDKLPVISPVQASNALSDEEAEAQVDGRLPWE